MRLAAPVTVRLATAVGLLWSFALVTSGMVFTYGMTTIVDLHETDPAQAEQTWQAVAWFLCIAWIQLRTSQHEGVS